MRAERLYCLAREGATAALSSLLLQYARLAGRPVGAEPRWLATRRRRQVTSAVTSDAPLNLDTPPHPPIHPHTSTTVHTQTQHCDNIHSTRL